MRLLLLLPPHNYALNWLHTYTHTDAVTWACLIWITSRARLKRLKKNFGECSFIARQRWMYAYRTLCISMWKRVDRSSYYCCLFCETRVILWHLKHIQISHHRSFIHNRKRSQGTKQCGGLIQLRSVRSFAADHQHRFQHRRWQLTITTDITDAYTFASAIRFRCHAAVIGELMCALVFVFLRPFHNQQQRQFHILKATFRMCFQVVDVRH